MSRKKVAPRRSKATRKQLEENMIDQFFVKLFTKAREPKARPSRRGR